LKLQILGFNENFVYFSFFKKHTEIAKRLFNLNVVFEQMERLEKQMDAFDLQIENGYVLPPSNSE